MNILTRSRNSAYRKIICILCFLLHTFLIDAQTNISGIVKDGKTSAGLAGAYIMAMSEDSSLAYSISDSEGRFSLKLSTTENVSTIRVSLLGYAPVQIPYKVGAGDFEILLSEKSLNLRSVTVKSSVIESKGDTLKYSAQSFADGTERVMSDLLEKLPGISVDKSGGIKYNGRYINKFYIEGMDLMGNRYGLATKKLSSEHIASVEIYKNHQPIRALKDVEYTGRSAVNIILKQDSKDAWLFTGDASLGVSKTKIPFDIKLLFSRFASKSQSLFLMGSNTQGEDIFTDLKVHSYDSDSKIITFSQDALNQDFITELHPRKTRLPLPQSFWYDNLSSLASINHLKKHGENILSRYSLQLAQERYNERHDQKEEVFLPDGNSLLIEDYRKNLQDSYYLYTSAALENNSDRLYIQDKLGFEGQFIVSHINSSNYSEEYKLPSLKLINDLKITSRTSSDQALSIESKTNYTQNQHEANFLINQEEVNQGYTNRSLISDNSVRFATKILGQNITFRAAADLELHKIGTKLENLSNEMQLWSFKPNVSFVGQSPLWGGILRYSLPINLDLIGSGSDGKYKKFRTNAVFNYHHKIGNAWEVDADASYRLSNSGALSLYDALIMENYRLLSKKDSLATQSLMSSNLRLRYSDHISMLYATLSASYSINGSDRVISYDYQPDYTIQTYLPVPITSDTWSLTTRVSKHLDVNRLSFEVLLGHSQSTMSEYLQASYIKYRQINSFLSGTLRAKPVNWFSANMQMRYDINTTYLSKSTSVNTFQIEGDVNFFMGEWTISTDIFYMKDFTGAISTFNKPMLSSEISRRIGKLNIFASARNLLNVITYEREYLSAYRTFSSISYLQPVQIVIGVRAGR